MVADDEVRVIHLRDEMRVTALLRDSHALADQARVHVGDRTLGRRNSRVGKCPYADSNVRRRDRYSGSQPSRYAVGSRRGTEAYATSPSVVSSSTLAP